jgi:hypothetical protein
MRKLTHTRILLPLALLLAHAASASAQAPLDARGALTAFPDAQAVLYINAHRIINEAMPRVIPPARYKQMLADTQKIGFDVRGLQYAAVGVRFADPAPANGLPEFVVVVKGDFNADALLALARVGLGTQNMKSRDESYGAKTIQIIDTTGLNKMMGSGGGGDGSTPKPSPYPEIGVTTLDSNTLVMGVPAYVKAAIDAAGGQGTLSASTLDLAAHDPQALWSFTANIPPTLLEQMHKFGVPPNAEMDRMLAWMKQLSLSQGLSALNFTLNAALATDQAEHASAVSGIIRMGLMAAQSALSEEAANKRGKDAIEARQALNVLRTMTNRTEGNTLVLGFSVPVKTVADLVGKEMATQSTPAGKATRRTGRKGATRRR